MFRQSIVVIVLSIGSFAAGRWLFPKEVTKVITKTEVKTQVETQWRERVVRTEKPTGDIITETIRETRQQAKEDTLLTSKKEYAHQYSVGVYRGINSWGLSVDRRLVGAIFVGIHGTTTATPLLESSTIGVGLRVEF